MIKRICINKDQHEVLWELVKANIMTVQLVLKDDYKEFAKPSLQRVAIGLNPDMHKRLKCIAGQVILANISTYSTTMKIMYINYEGFCYPIELFNIVSASDAKHLHNFNKDIK